jgi:DNA helicase-2/ATP-dependent DNA helicase PcrA
VIPTGYFETFTTASPEYLRNFLTEPGVQPRELPDSGRSSLQIIDLANYLIDWTQTQHPREAARGALTPPTIHPVPPGDQQPNPPAGKVHFHLNRLTAAEEIQTVANSLASWLPDHPDETAAVLVPRNQRGFESLAQAPPERADQLLRSSTHPAGSWCAGQRAQFHL